MTDRQFVQSLVDTVLLAGAPGSDAYAAALAQLQADQAAARVKISTGYGKQVMSVSAGESVSWGQSMTFAEFFQACTDALKQLQGMIMVRRTSALFLN